MYPMHPKVDARFLAQFSQKPIEEMDCEAKAAKLHATTPRRCSRLTKPVDCVLCGKRIQVGEMYRDGGLHNRAHDRCVEVP